MSSADDLLSAAEVAAEYPPLTRAMLWRWARTGKISVVELPSGRKFFNRSDIEALLMPSSGSAGSADSAGDDDLDSQPFLPGL